MPVPDIDSPGRPHLVYDELRAVAGRYFGSQPARHTLQPTALVHEAFLKLAGAKNLDWKDRAHFLAVCATAMRNLLTDHARRKGTDKRGGGWRRVTLADVEGRKGTDDVDVLDLDEALTRLEELNERQARIVEYRFFGGMSVPEIAHRLDVSVSTVENGWRGRGSAPRSKGRRDRQRISDRLMDRDRYERVQELFLRACELPAEERAGYLGATRRS